MTYKKLIKVSLEEYAQAKEDPEFNIDQIPEHDVEEDESLKL